MKYPKCTLLLHQIYLTFFNVGLNACYNILVKHALVTLIIILFVVLLVLPLMFIAFGKLKNPIDLFALNKASNSVAKNSFISPNYVPDPNNGVAPTSNVFTEVQKQIDTCFKGMPLVDASAFKYDQTPGQRAQIVNNKTGATWVVSDYTFSPIKNPSGISNYAYFVTEQANDVCTRDAYLSSKLGQLFGVYTDSNQYIKKIYDPSKYDDSSNFDLVDQGVSTIAGHSYHWYVFEGKNRLAAGKYDEVLYQSVFVTFDDMNNRVQNFTIQGSNSTFKSSRDLLKTGQNLLTGLSFIPKQPTVAASSTAGASAQ